MPNLMMPGGLPTRPLGRPEQLPNQVPTVWLQTVQTFIWHFIAQYPGSSIVKQSVMEGVFFAEFPVTLEMNTVEILVLRRGTCILVEY